MCGIAGYYGFEGKKLLKKFSEQLHHRGPDGEGVFIQPGVGLLSRRLAIIDIKGGNQPIFNEDKTIVVVYNGEIYNYEELKLNLIKKGHQFITKTDTEIIVHMYEEEGLKGFSRFNGMFAIALYDIKNKKLILARDQFGIKPLYYTVLNNGIIFSSEIKPIIRSRLITPRVNEKTLFRYLMYRIHDDGKDTFFEDVIRLTPGELIECYMEDKKIVMNNYSLKIASNLFYSEKKIIHKKNLGDLLKEAVKKRLVSEVPVGTCLSGGIDSSSIAGYVYLCMRDNLTEAKSVGKRQNTFSAVFPTYSNDEERYIDMMSKKYPDITCHKVNPSSKDFVKDVIDFVRTQEEPTVSTGPYAQYRVMKEAKKYVTVLLDGQGADELLAGYIPYYFVYLRELIAKRKFFRFLFEILMSLDIFTSMITKNFFRAPGRKKQIDMKTLINEDFYLSRNGDIFRPINDNLSERLREDVFKNSLQALLRYEDRNSMRFSIEGRLPFLDNDLYAYIHSLPSNMIIRNGWNKYVLRKAVCGIIPEKIRKRRNKIGFTTPEYNWFHEQKEWIMSIFKSQTFSKRKYFNQKRVLNAFQEFLDKKTSDTLVFWRILNTELWLREFIDPFD